MRKHGIYLPKDIFNGKKSGTTSVDQISKYTPVPESVSKTLNNILFVNNFPSYRSLDTHIRLVKA